MYAYLITPVLIIIGLCCFSYLIGRYTAGGYKTKKADSESSGSGEEIKRLKAMIEEKNEEAEAKNRLTETTLKEYQELLIKNRKESNKRADEQREEVLNTIKLKKRISRLEAELKKNGISIEGYTTEVLGGSYDSEKRKK